MNKPPIIQLINKRIHINYNREYSTYTNKDGNTINRWDWDYIGLGFSPELFNYYNIDLGYTAWGITVLGLTLYKAHTLDYEMV